MNKITDVNQAVMLIKAQGLSTCPEYIDPTVFQIAMSRLTPSWTSDSAPWEESASNTIQMTPANLGQVVPTPQRYVPATVPTQQPSSFRPQNGSCFTLDDVQSNIAVDAFLKLNNGSVMIGDKEVKTPFKATVVGSSSRVARAILDKARGGTFGKYHMTYDGITTKEGENFPAIVAQVKMRDPQAYEYWCFELVLRLDEDIKTVDGKTVIAEKGSTLGHTTAPTIGKEMKSLFESVKKEKGLSFDTDEIAIVVSTRIRRTKNRPDGYKVLDFQPV